VAPGFLEPLPHGPLRASTGILSAMDRRDFHKVGLGTLLGASLFGCSTTRRGADPLFATRDERSRPLLLSASNGGRWGRGKLAESSRNYLGVYDVELDQLRHFESPCFIHSITQHPLEKSVFLCLPKLGGTACVFDYTAGTMTPFESSVAHRTFRCRARSDATMAPLRGIPTTMSTCPWKREAYSATSRCS
jgi:hypothetical protein